MKKRNNRFQRISDEIDNISKVLHEEGKSDGECRYKELIAEILLFIEYLLTSISRTLIFLAGALLGHLLFGR